MLQVIACALLAGKLNLLRTKDRDHWEEAPEESTEENKEGDVILRTESVVFNEPNGLVHQQIR